MLDQIYNEDCEKGLKALPSNFVQVIMTSPPYNVKKPYSDYSDNLEYTEYKAFMRRIFSECLRILRPEGVCFVNIANCKSNPFKAFDMAYTLRQAGFTLIDTIIWHKPSPRYLNTNRILTNAYEFVFMCAKSRRYSFNKLAIGLPCKTQPGLKCRTNV